MKLITKRLNGKVEVTYAFQTIDRLPKGFAVPEGRTKLMGHCSCCALRQGCD